MSGSHASRLNARWIGVGPVSVVLGNGLGTNPGTWRFVVEALRSEARLLTFQYPGSPDVAPEEYRADAYASLHAYADDVLSLLAEEDVSDVVFVGHSVSAMIGALAAIAAPERIGRLVMLSGSPRYLDDIGYVGGFTREAVDELLAQVMTDFHAWAAGFAPLALGADATAEGIHEFSSELRRLRPDVALSVLRTIFLGDYRPILPHVRQQTVVLQPDQDVAVPLVVGDYLARTLPNATLRRLHARGHVPQLTAPDEVIRELRAVLGERGA